MGINRVSVAAFAVGLAREKHGWNKAEFARQIFGDDRRQVVNGWLKRGLPADQDLNVAQTLGLTVEQLLAAGELEIPEAPLPPEAIEFAREWLQLPPLTRHNIRTMVLGLLGPGRDEGHKGLPQTDRPFLQRRRGA